MLRKGFLDIEVYCKTGFPFPEQAAHPICSWSYYDSYTDRHYTIIIDPSRDGQALRSVLNEKTGRDNWDIYFVGDERKLIICSIKLIKFFSPDIMSGWYSDSFDFPYYFNRCVNLEMKRMLDSISPLGFTNVKKHTVSGMNIFDLITGDKKIKKRSSYTLEDVAKEENLPVLKTESHEDLNEIYEKDKMRFATYNKGDVEVLEYLEKKLKIIDFYENTRTFAGLNDINEAMKNSVIIDVVALRKARKEGIVLPTKPTREESKESDEDEDKLGALVKFPPPGIWRNVVVLDMSKFYPTILKLLNLSSETIVKIGLTIDQIIKDDGFLYVEYEEGKYCKVRTDIEGFMPSLYGEFLKERLAVESEIKNHEIDSPEYNFLMQKRQVVKDTSNSLPGVNGYTGFRLYNVAVFNGIIYTGRKMISRTEKMVEDLGLRDIYSDTDSRHIAAPEEVSVEELVKLGHELSEKFSKAYVPMVEEEFNLKCDSAFEIDFEKAFKTIIYIKKDDGTPAKKRYAARECYEKGKDIDVLYVRGFETRRSDAPAYAKKLQEQIFRLILWDHPKTEVISYVKEMIAGFRQVPLSNIGVPKGINFNLESYGGLNKNGGKKGIPAQIKGAIYSNTHLGTNYNGGSKVKYIYVKEVREIEGKVYPHTDVLSFDNENIIPRGTVVDYDRMIKLVIQQKAERILAAAGISWERDIEGKKTLFDFEE